MDKSGIPIHKVTIEDREISVYKWLTAEEDDEYRLLLMGDKEFDISEELIKEGKLKTTLSMDGVAKANRFLIEHMCVDLKWEEYNVWNPDKRSLLLEEINKVREAKK